jgi:SAM-dependent methyltransferase
MDRVSEFYARHAARYDRSRSRALMERDYLERVTRLVAAPARVLDLGCGGGEPLARYFVERGYEITGVDVVGDMIALCRARFPDMSWLCADMRALALSRSFDVVLAWDSFFHLDRDDQRAMFATFRRHTAPGGVLLFTSGPTDGEAIGTAFGEALYHASLSPREYEARLREHGYEVLLHRVEDPDCGGHTVWLARLASASSPAS